MVRFNTQAILFKTCHSEHLEESHDLNKQHIKRYFAVTKNDARLPGRQKKKVLQKSHILIVALLITVFSGCINSNNNKLSIDEPAHIPKIAYGINVDTLIVITNKVKKNEFLSDILLKYGVSYGDIDHIARKTKKVFDVRKIVTGNSYSVICTNDSLQKALYFAYELSRAKYVLYSLFDSIVVKLGEKEIVNIENHTSGEIISSLWNAMVDNNSDPNLANELSEIYAWTIDFFGLQKGDSYKAIFEEQTVDSTYIGLADVKATMFYHGGDSLYAFYFEQNGKGDYFDEKGNSLQRTFLKAPLRFTRISSKFSNSRLHPVLKIRRPHQGIDYAAPSGTPVYSVGDGTVIKKGYQKRGGGNYVTIKHNGTYSTTYMHLNGYAKGIKVGKNVKQSELIGYVGSSGLSTGPHLDFRFYRNGKPVDPLKVKSPPSLPIDTANQARFDSVVKHYLVKLNLF
ncbi:MAG: peptidoglycan DD-metalloendopeptidase family protein [Bacteroidetes bacterium]|nr:peptidoglycan DD-metalloendopeptidase family protein [Bacteroidota bacterium]